MKKNQKGITLVALAVTIVVIMILAGISINAIVGDDGLIKKAQQSADLSNEAEAKETINRAILEFYTAREYTTLYDFLLTKKEKGTIDNVVENSDGTLTISKNGYTVNSENKTKTTSKSDDTTENNGYMKQNTKVTYPDGDVWIPEGFKIADDSASTVQGGVVIEDKDQNQFVWIPVASISDYKRTAYSTNVDTNETDSETNSTKINHSNSVSYYYYTEALPSDEQTSVNTYKGYYIGRYEAGDKESTEAKTLRSSNDVSKTVTIKANQAPYNYVTRTQAKTLAENFGTQQGYKAKTKLVSSYAWDTAIAFIQETVNDYGTSSPQGNYSNTPFTYNDITVKEGEEKTKTKDKKSFTLVATGQTTPVCNIYDMGGNVWEWTTESCSNTPGYPCTYRGGYYSDNYAVNPAGTRNGHSGLGYGHIGFRLTLFL